MAATSTRAVIKSVLHKLSSVTCAACGFYMAAQLHACMPWFVAASCAHIT